MPSTLARAPSLARIDEAACIGCTLCIAVCPVDAIVGAAKLMHTVLAERCTGCELCLPPCPVDCIALVPRSRPWTAADAARAHANEEAHDERLASLRGPVDAPARAPLETTRAQRQAAVAAALGRARARRAAQQQAPARLRRSSGGE